MHDWEAARGKVRSNLVDRLRQVDVPAEVASRIATSGRLTRPVLFLLVVSPGLDLELIEEVSELAAALELIHRASVIRDDIEDDDKLRRGMPTEFSIFGAAGALALSDVLLMAGIDTLTRASHIISQKLSVAVLKMARGQFFDLHGPPPTITAPYAPAELKTGSLIAFTFWLGGYCSGRSEGDCDTLDGIGFQLGTAFQLMNDVRNVTLNEGRGKPLGSDLADNRYSSITLLLKSQEGISSAEPRSIAAAAQEIQREVASRLLLAQNLADTLAAPLVGPLRELIFNVQTARDFVADQQL
jgi:geranylgeranyl pyrophosphate synthase